MIYRDLDMLTDGLQPSTPGSLSMRDRLIFCFTVHQGFNRFKTVKDQGFQTPLCVPSREHFLISFHILYLCSSSPHLYLFIYITSYFPCSCKACVRLDIKTQLRLFSYFCYFDHHFFSYFLIFMLPFWLIEEFTLI